MNGSIHCAQSLQPNWLRLFTPVLEDPQEESCGCSVGVAEADAIEVETTEAEAIEADAIEAEATEPEATEHSIGILVPPALLAASVVGCSTDPAEATEAEVTEYE